MGIITALKIASDNRRWQGKHMWQNSIMVSLLVQVISLLL